MSSSRHDARLPAQEKTASIFVSSGLLGAAMVVVRLSNVVVLALLARSSGLESVAYYGIATLAASLGALTFSFGFPTYLTKSVSGNELPSNVVRDLHWLRFPALILAMGVIAAGAYVCLQVQYLVPFLVLSMAVLLDQWNETAWPAIRGGPFSKREPVINAATNISFLVCAVCAFVLGWMSFLAVAILACSFSILRSMLCLTSTRSMLPDSMQSVARTFRQHGRSALPYLASDVLGVAYLRGDTFILTAFVTATSVGSYVAAGGLVNPLVQVAAAMGFGALAYASRSRRSGTENTSNVTIVHFFQAVGFAFCGVLILSAPTLVSILYGTGDDASQIAPLVIVLSLFVSFRFTNFSLSTILLSGNLVLLRLAVLLGSVVLNVALNLFLDPILGTMGAAWATVITEICIFAAFLISLKSSAVRRASVFTVAFGTLSITGVLASQITDTSPRISAILIGLPVILSAMVLLWRQKVAILNSSEAR